MAGQLVTAAVAVVALLVTARASKIAARSVGIAERALESQTRPLLTDVDRQRIEGPPREVVLPDGSARDTSWEGEIFADADEGWLSLPVRNAGRGEAIVEAIKVELPIAEFELSAGYASRRHVQPGEETRIYVGPGRVNLAFGRLQQAIADGAGIIVHLTYSSPVTRSRQTTAFELERIPGAPWRAARMWEVEHS